MDLGIIGLERSGKTAVFGAVTRGHASAAGYGAMEPNIGVVKVPDDRLDRLCELLHSKKITYIETRFLDFPGGLSFRDREPPAAYLAALSQCDALVHVVRAFENDSVPHPAVTIDAHRDISDVNMELAFADMAQLQRRQERLEIEVRSARAGQREPGEREMALLARLGEGLEREEPLRSQEISPEERKTIGGYQLLTNRPLLILLNISEGDIAKAAEIEAEYSTRWNASGVEVAALCGKLEQELSELSDSDAEEFRRDLGIGEGSLARMLSLSQRALGLISFFTVGEKEGRAWALASGLSALEAGGKIHTDIARGFIRAEVIGCDEMLDCGSWAAARKQGLLRMEGKLYVIQDGDLINILFNV